MGVCQAAHVPCHLPRCFSYTEQPMYFAIYLDVLAILVLMSLEKQKEEHDPIKAARRIQNFKWTIASFRFILKML